jgi:amidohydrolase
MQIETERYLVERIRERLVELFPAMVEWRRYLHQHPELSFQEENTPRWIADKLTEWGLEVRIGVGGRGVVARLTGAWPGPTVALRADFDALPMHDEKDVVYRSTVPGVMHACGHDAHTATLLGVARALSEVREGLRGTIVFLFQHAEEHSPGGARPMIDDGALVGVDAVYGVHLWTPFPVGQLAVCYGPMMAAADEFHVRIHGKGGHGGLPHQAVDALAVASHFVVNLQTLVSRQVDPLRSAVISVGTIHAGSNFNIIAEEAVLTGTVRSYDPQLREELVRRIEQVLDHTCRMYDATHSYDYQWGYPPVVNHAAEVARLQAVGERLLGIHRVVQMTPVMAGEDFSYYLQERPGTYCFIGAGNVEKGIVYPHHHPRFDIDEDAMLTAAEVLTFIALQYINDAQNEQQPSVL